VEFLDNSLSIREVTDIENFGKQSGLPAENDDCVIWYKSTGKKKPAKYAAKVLLYNGKCVYFTSIC